MYGAKEHSGRYIRSKGHY